MTGHQEWIDEESPLSITEQANDARRRDSTRGCASNRVDEILDLSTAFRIPNAPVGNGANVDLVRPLRRRGAFVTNPRDGFAQPGPPTARTPSLRACTATGAAARRAHRPLPPKWTFGSQNGANSRPNGRFGEIAVRGPAGARHDHLLGRAVLHARAGACSAPRSSMSSRRARPDGTRLIAGVPVTETSGGSSRRSSRG